MKENFFSGKVANKIILVSYISIFPEERPAINGGFAANHGYRTGLQAEREKKEK